MRKIDWFSRLVRHPARKRSESILTTPEPARGEEPLMSVTRGQCHARPTVKKKKVKEADIAPLLKYLTLKALRYVRITQCHLQITPYLPLPHKHSPDGASQTEVADI